jgi:hypothetical protein
VSTTGTTQAESRIYLAARYTRRLELCGYRDDLTAMGFTVTSRWLDGSHQLDNEGRPLGDMGELLFEAGSPEVDHFRWKFATDDLEDVLASETLIAVTEEPRSGNSRGGRHVELGIALGTGRHHVVIVGPRENVFCWLPDVEWYPDWASLVAAWAPKFAEAGR